MRDRTHLHNPNDDVLESRSIGVVVQNEATIGLCAPERWRPHPGIKCGQMVMEGVQVLVVEINV